MFKMNQISPLIGGIIYQRTVRVGHCCLLFLFQKKQDLIDRIIPYNPLLFCYVYSQSISTLRNIAILLRFVLAIIS